MYEEFRSPTVLKRVKVLIESLNKIHLTLTSPIISSIKTSLKLKEQCYTHAIVYLTCIFIHKD